MRKMSTVTIGTLPRLSSKALSDIILSHSSSNLDAPSAPHTLAIVDVRDDGTFLRSSQKSWPLAISIPSCH